jgi:hypothetical protein
MLPEPKPVKLIASAPISVAQHTKPTFEEMQKILNED